MLYRLFRGCSFFNLKILSFLLSVAVLSACSSSSDSSSDSSAASDDIFALDNYGAVESSDNLTGLWVGVAEYNESVVATDLGLLPGIYRASHVKERRIISISASSDENYYIYETQQFMGLYNLSSMPGYEDQSGANVFNFGSLFRDPVALTAEPPDIDAAGFSVDIASNTSLVLNKLREFDDIAYSLKKVSNTPVDIASPSTAIGTIQFDIERSLEGEIVDARTITAPIYSVVIQHRNDKYHYADLRPLNESDASYRDEAVELLILYFDGSEFGPYMLEDERLYDMMDFIPYGISVLTIERIRSDGGDGLRIDGESDHKGEILQYSLSPNEMSLDIRYQTVNPFKAIYGGLGNLEAMLQLMFGSGAESFELDYRYQITASVQTNI